MFQKIFLVLTVINYIFITDVRAVLNLDLGSNRHPFDMQLYEDVLDLELCQRQLNYLTTDTGLLARFLDAGIRVPRGILTGNTVDLGNFYQCMDIEEKVEDMDISGKYCRIQVPMEQNLYLPEFSERSLLRFDPSNLQVHEKIMRQLEQINHKKALKLGLPGSEIRTGSNIPLGNLTFNLAVCIPRVCSTQQAIDGLLFNMTTIGFEYSDISCRLPDDKRWAAVDYIASVVFSIIALVTVISTSYDVYQSIYLKKDSKQISPAYVSFSVYTNARRLLTFNSSPGSLECLDGIRTLAIIWIILGHSFAVAPGTTNPTESFQWAISSGATWVTLSPISVDTFFFLSGLLLVYTTVGKLGRREFLKNLHLFYLHRLLRMLPILAAVILFESSFYMHISDGPLWDQVAVRSLTCREYWWSALLYLQNFLNAQDVCIVVTWYLAIDMQLYVLSPIILFWVLTSKRAAWVALNASLLISLTASTIFIFFRNFPSGIMSPNRPDDNADYVLYYYANTLTRASPFFVGMVYGYLLHLWRKKKLEVPKVLTIFLLLCSLMTMLVVLYCSYIAMKLDWNNQLADNFFNSFLRPLWGLALGWMIFACVNGRAGPINWFLSHRMWKLPARISYAMYLLHMSIMVAFYSTLPAPIHFSVGYLFFHFMGFMLVTFILSFFVTLLIDSPFSTIFKLLLEGVMKTKKATTSEDDVLKENNDKGESSFTSNESTENLKRISIVSEKTDGESNITQKREHSTQK